MKRKLRVLGPFIVVLLLPGLVMATTLVKLSTDQMLAQSSNVVLGECTAVRSRWIGRNLVTLATISVAESLKGDTSDELTLVIPGGVDVNRPIPIAVTYPGAPVVVPSDEVALFLEHTTAIENGYRVVGFSQGKLSIVQDAFGRKLVSSSRSAGSDAVELEAFKRRIRSASGSTGGDDFQEGESK